VEIALKGQPIRGSPFTAVFRGASAGHSYAEGEGLSKGKTKKPANFNIISVGANGKPMGKGGEPFVVEIDGPAGKLNPELNDNGNGVYPVQYFPQQEGKYNISATLFGEHIRGSPFTAQIKRAPNPAKSYVEGPGLKKAFDNKPTYFNLHAVDDLGSPVSGDHAEVTMRPADPRSGLRDVEVKVEDQGDGTYRCDYFAPQAGDYIISVGLDDMPVQGTPVKLRVRVGADASKFKASDAKFMVTIVSHDKNGEIKKEGGDDWQVRIEAPLNPKAKVDVATKDNVDGSYSATYKLPTSEAEAVEYLVHMSLNGDAFRPLKQYM